MKLSHAKRIESLINYAFVVGVNLTLHKPQCDTCNLEMVEPYFGSVFEEGGRVNRWNKICVTNFWLLER